MKNRNTKSWMFVWIAFLTFSIANAAEPTKKSTEPTKAPVVDKKAEELLKKMSDLLANSQNFTFRTKGVEERVRRNGKKVAVEITRDVAVRRPDGVWVHATGKAPDKSRDVSIWYDGKTLLLQSENEKVYARTKVPPTIDETLDYVGSTLRIPTPMGDVLYSSPYDAYLSADTSARYVKLTNVDGKSCHELAFQNPGLDYTIWVADGEQPLLCKLELSYKTDEKTPKATMTFYDWNFSPQFAADRFTHEPPAEFKKIQIIGRVDLEEEQSSEAPTQTQEN